MCGIDSITQPSPTGAKPNTRRLRVTPRWGWDRVVIHDSQGGALGYGVIAPLARNIIHPGGTPPPNPWNGPMIAPSPHKTICPNGAKPCSLGQRPRTTPPTHSPSPNGAKPNTRRLRVAPRWGWGWHDIRRTQGGALGSRGNALGNLSAISWCMPAPPATVWNYWKETAISA